MAFTRTTLNSGDPTTKNYGFWQAYVTAEETYVTKLAAYNTKMEDYDDKLIAIATAEADWKLARGQWLTNTRLIDKWTVLVAVSNTDQLATKTARDNAK